MVAVVIAGMLFWLGRGDGAVHVSLDDLRSADGLPFVARLRPGQELVVSLDANATTGYRWTITRSPDRDVLAPVAEDYLGPGQDAPIGAGGVKRFEFEAVRPGSTALQLRYFLPGQAGEHGVSYELQVDVVRGEAAGQAGME